MISICLLCVNAQAQGSAGSALQFNGTNSYVTTSASLGGVAAMSVEVWIKPTNLNLTAEQVIVQERSTSPPDWVLKFTGYGANLYFGVQTSSPIYGRRLGFAELPINPAAFVDGHWHQVAASYDGTTFRVYHDGFLMFTGSLGTEQVSIGGSQIVIGATGGNPGSFFYGLIDEVRIWSIARTPEELCQTMNQSLTGAEFRLAAYWRFDEGVGTTVQDSSGHGRSGVLVNGPGWVPSAALQAIPIVTTLGSSNVTATSAVLTGNSTECGLPALAWFEYGTTISYDQRTPAIPVMNNNPAGITQTVANLVQDTLYHFRCAVSNVAGQNTGGDLQFKTAGLPKVTTLNIWNLAAQTATLQGIVNPNGLETAAWFEWGDSASYGVTTASQALSNGINGIFITQLVAGLVPGQSYHYRIIATNSEGLAAGTDQLFTPAFSNSFSGTVMSAPIFVAWGDYDRDGALDLMALSGFQTNGFTMLYTNQSGTLSLAFNGYSWYDNAALPSLQPGSADWGDFDNDGALDLLLTGRSGWYSSRPALSQIYRNDHGSFTTNVTATLAPVLRGSGAWADYDNDGHLDFLIVGSSDPFYLSTTNVLYHNNGDGTFTDVHAGLPPLVDSSIAWGDYDNDGFPDLLIAGSDGVECTTKVYHNDHGTFHDIGAQLIGVASGSVAWGDFDGDGWPDILLAGSTNNTSTAPRCLIYRNNHDGTFSDIGASLPGVYQGSAAWGDYDNDGQLDILLTGIPATFGPPAARIYRQDHGVFTDVGAGLPLYTMGRGVWGDYDGDGKLDLALAGASWPGLAQTMVYRNYLTITNMAPNQPTAPTGLSFSVSTNGVTLHWAAATDAHTSSAGLTYNVRVGTTPRGGQVVPSHSDPLTGQRQLPHTGNAEHRLFTIVTNLPVGSFYWSVQAVNQGFVGSAWAPEQTFAITQAPPAALTLSASNVLSYSAVIAGQVVPSILETWVWFEWGTDTSLGHQTPPVDVGTGLAPVLVTLPMASLQPRTTYFYRLVATNVAGSSYGTNGTFRTLIDLPSITTLPASNISYSSAQLNSYISATDSTAQVYFEWGTTTNFGQITAPLPFGAGMGFEGYYYSQVSAGGALFASVTNFTIEFWAWPLASQSLLAESVTDYAVNWEQRFVVGPEGVPYYGNLDDLGPGIAVGNNGINVVEWTYYYHCAPLAYAASLTGWTHVAVTYSNSQPSLYLNGQWVRTGLRSRKRPHPGANIGQSYVGRVDEFRVWNALLSSTTLQLWMNRELSTNHPAWNDLLLYWRLNEGNGSTVSDASGHGVTGGINVYGDDPHWIGSTPLSQPVSSAFLSNLVPGTTYYFRAVATNSAGVVRGETRTFTTWSLPRVVGAAFRPDFSFRLTFSGSAGQTYTLQASTNLVNWLSLTNLSAGPDGLFEFLDNSATNFHTRFYRLTGL